VWEPHSDEKGGSADATAVWRGQSAVTSAGTTLDCPEPEESEASGDYHGHCQWTEQAVVQGQLGLACQ
jgi:hypothetical protein